MTDFNLDTQRKVISIFSSEEELNISQREVIDFLIEYIFSAKDFDKHFVRDCLILLKRCQKELVGRRKEAEENRRWERKLP